MVMVDCQTGYRWLYCMKTRDDMLQAVKLWYRDIADLHQKHALVLVMRDNADKSREIMEYFDNCLIPWEQETISAHRMNNGRMDLLKRQLNHS